VGDEKAKNSFQILQMISCESCMDRTGPAKAMTILQVRMGTGTLLQEYAAKK
jgi:hypothetical protein